MPLAVEYKEMSDRACGTHSRVFSESEFSTLLTKLSCWSVFHASRVPPEIDRRGLNVHAQDRYCAEATEAGQDLGSKTFLTGPVDEFAFGLKRARTGFNTEASSSVPLGRLRAHRRRRSARDFVSRYT